MKTAIYIVIFFMTVGCIDRNQKTTIKVIDNNRHYYPVLQGQELDIVFPIVNTGKAPFILQDIITSCGCLTVETSSVKTIPPGEEGHLVLKYNSTKNIGLTELFITLYGNFEKEEKLDISFDLHVVPDALYTKDYEELYMEANEKEGSIKTMVEGKQKGYYMN